VTPWLVLLLAAEPGFELVLSAPIETTLERQDLRSPRVVWPELFDTAKRSIDLAEFYVADQKGEALEAVIDSLGRAAKRGVRIRILLEKKMEAVSKTSFDKLRAFPKLELRMIEYGKLGAGDGILHAKYFVVDGARAYLGSQNFDWRSLSHVHELGVRITDAEIGAQLESIFEQDWGAAERLASGKAVPSFERSSPPIERPAYLVASPAAYDPPGVGDSEAELVRLIGVAKRAIKVELLDYCPLDYKKREYYAPIDTALRAAAARGVELRILVSNWNAEAPCIEYVKSLAAVPKVEIRMVSIPEAKAGFIPYARVIHAKYMLVDDRLLWLGTSNWSGGYLDRSRNVELVLKDPKLVEQARSIHDQVWASAYAAPISACGTYTPPRRH
jgi:phosphatidylserine/phosphatidylglycerophosphate/cardiolipin synthase-like enzyme